MKNIFLILILLLGKCVTAQNLDNVSNTGMLVYTKSETPDEFTGSPYVEKDFTEGRILDVDKDKYQTAYLKYNAIEDVVEIKLSSKDTKVHILPKLKNIQYDLGTYKYIIDNFKLEEGGYLEGYFLDYFSNDKIRFLAYPEGDLEPAIIGKGYKKSKPAHLSIEYTYFIQKDGGPLEEVKLKQKDFKKMFSNEEVIQSYLDDNKIKDEMDVVEMLKYYFNH